MNSRSWTRMLAVTSVAALVGVVGCGGDGEVNSEYRSEAQSASVTQDVVSASQTEVAAARTQTNGEDVAPPIVRDGTFPPDIAVSVPDTMVQPGQSIELVTEGTPDVSEIVLWDGYGDRQAFTRGAGADVWRVTYRVPLRPKSERLGLSVTARNEANRWCRRWVFLRVGSEGAPPPVSGAANDQEPSPAATETKSGDR